MNQGLIDIIDIGIISYPVRTGAPSIGWVTLMWELFNTYQLYFISNITSTLINRKYSKHLFHFIRSSTEVIEFDDVQFPKRISSKNGVWGEFLETDSKSTFSRKLVLQKRELSYPFFQLISYNNLFVTKQI